jgi:hypothetical protein
VAFVPVPNTAQFAMRFTEQGQQVENVFHLHDTTPWVASAMLTWCAFFKAGWVASLQSLVTYQLSLNSIIARDISTEFGAGVEYSDGLPLIGDDFDGGAPMNVTLAIKWATGLAGRSFRGRTYHLGIINNQITDSRISGALVSDLQAAYSALKTAVEVGSVKMVVVSRVTGGVPRTTGVATPITGVSVNAVTDSQRRRLPERGS